jgi:hypothetical protein
VSDDDLGLSDHSVQSPEAARAEPACREDSDVDAASLSWGKSHEIHAPATGRQLRPQVDRERLGPTPVVARYDLKDVTSHWTRCTRYRDGSLDRLK